MTKLCDIVEILENNIKSITLKIKDDKKIELISLGFDPKLEFIYLLKGKNNTMKLVNKDSSVTSFDFGESGYTIISTNMKNQKQLILDCITNDFGIAYDGDSNYLEKTSYIKTQDDKKELDFNIQLQWFEEDNIVMHRDNSFFKNFFSLAEAKKYIQDYYDIYDEKPLRLSNQTGCKILEFNCRGKECQINNEKDL